METTDKQARVAAEGTDTQRDLQATAREIGEELRGLRDRAVELWRHL